MKRLALPTLLILLLAAAAVVVVYLPALHGPFVFDDLPHIVDNPSVRIVNLDLPSLLQAAAPSLSNRRPLAFLTFGIDYFFWKRDPFGYRLFNLAILLLSIPAAFWAAFLIARTWLPPSEARVAALGAAILWSLHPLLTNGVSYIVQRMTSLCALFSLLALAFLLQGRLTGRWKWYTGGALCWALALASKEIAVLLPLVALLLLWLDPGTGEGGRRWAGGLLLAALLAGQGALFFFALHGGGYDIQSFTLSERVLTEGRVVARYLTLFLLPLPSRLNLDYDLPLSTSFFEPFATLPAGFLHLLLCGAALALRRRRPLLAFGILSFYLLQLLESTVLPLEIIFEHRAYLPSFFLALALADLLQWIFGFAAPRRAPEAALLAALLIAALWGGMTFHRNTVWGDGVRFWRDASAKSPLKARTHDNLGFALAGEGRVEEAIASYREAIRLRPDLAKAHNNLGISLARQGNYMGAMVHFEEALRLKPAFAYASINLGNVLFVQGRTEAAKKRYREAIRANPRIAESHNNLGYLLAGEGLEEEALAHYREALRVDPDYAFAHFNLAELLRRQGRKTEAEAHYRRAIEIRPNYLEALNRLEEPEPPAGRH